MKRYIWIILAVASLPATAQKERDTSEMIAILSKVMQFSVRPDLSFTVQTDVTLDPVLSLPDSTAHATGKFYKHNDDLYYGNDRQETYLQDSLIIRIDHARKTIDIGKVDVASKKRMDVLPLKEGDLRKLLQSEYTISGERQEDGTERMILRPKAGPGGSPVSREQEILLEYTPDTYLLKRMAVATHLHQPDSPSLDRMLADKGVDVEKIRKSVEGITYLDIVRTMTISFSGVSLDAENAVGMPSWKDALVYNAQGESFTGKGRYEGYKVTKTF